METKGSIKPRYVNMITTGHLTIIMTVLSAFVGAVWYTSATNTQIHADLTGVRTALDNERQARLAAELNITTHLADVLVAISQKVDGIQHAQDVTNANTKESLVRVEAHLDELVRASTPSRRQP